MTSENERMKTRGGDGENTKDFGKKVRLEDKVECRRGQKNMQRKERKRSPINLF